MLLIDCPRVHVIYVDCCIWSLKYYAEEKLYLYCIFLQDRMPREDSQTPAQRQAAAKLALRKQLEKTLLQVSTL